jgi:hypothetical protein
VRQIPLPDYVPPLTPISYYVGTVSKAYTRRIKVRSYLRKIKGRKRRVRVTVYREIEIPARRSLSWAVQFPELRARWLNVADYQQGIEAQKEQQGFEVTERDMEIFHQDPENDVIHAVEEIRAGRVVFFGHSLFVWKRPKLPVNLKVFKRGKPFRMVRIWFWVYHTEKKEYRIWCRSSLITNSEFEEAWNFSDALYTEVSDDIEEAFTYLEVRGLLAWTAYARGERARRRDTRSLRKESRGSQ